MTFLEQQDLVLSWLDDVNAGYFTRPEVKRWLNNAQAEVQKNIIQYFEGYFQKTVETYLVIAQKEYNLPSDFKKLVRLEIVLSGTAPSSEDRIQLSKITHNQQDFFIDQQGTPRAYYFNGNQLILVPAPNSAFKMRMDYVYRLQDLASDSDTTEIPAEYQELMCVLATLDGFYKDGRDASPMLTKKAYFEEQMRADAEQRNVDAPRTVVQTIDDDFESLY